MPSTTLGGDPDYPVDAAVTVAAKDIAAAWRRELPGVRTASIEVITPLWRAAKVLADDRRRTLRRLDVEPAVLDLLSTLRRAGPPYELTTREITKRALVTAGAISQRIARAERNGLVTRSRSDTSRRAVSVALTPAGHELIESTVRELLTHEETLIEPFTAEQRTILATLLSKLATDQATQ